MILGILSIGYSLPKWERIDAGFPNREYQDETPDPSQLMVYDADMECVVSLIEETLWKWEDDRWTPIPSANAAPDTIDSSRLVYDTLRNVYVLWIDNNVYEWNGVQWDQIEPLTIPPERSSPVFVYDPVRKVSHLFGGYDVDHLPATFSDHWTWDGTDWNFEEDFTTGPLTTRAFSSDEIAFDEKRGMLFLGYLKSGDTYKIWEWGDKGWSDFEFPLADLWSSNPPDDLPDVNFIIPVYDSVEEIIRIMPSGTGWDGENLIPRPFVNQPYPLYDDLHFTLVHSCCFDKKRNGVLYRESGHYSNTWEWDKSVWRLKSPVNALVHSPGIMFFDKARNEMLLLNQNRELYSWENDKWEIRPCSSKSPVAQYPVATTLDENASDILLLNYNPVKTQMWRWDGADWSQDFPSTIPMTINQALVFDHARNMPFYACARTIQTSPKSIFEFQQWIWSGDNWIREYPETAPIAKGPIFMVSDPVRKLAHLFCFYKSDMREPLLEHWQWNGVEWENLPEGPQNSPEFIFVPFLKIYFDPEEDAIRIVDTNPPLLRIWHWNGSSLELTESFGIGMRQLYDPLIPQIEYYPINHSILMNASYDSFYSFTFEKTTDSLSLVSDGFKHPLCDSGGIFKDEIRNTFILQGGIPDFGPIVGCGHLDPDTWEWDGKEWKWIWNISQPTSGEGFQLVYDSYRKRAVSFSGDICYLGEIPVPSNETNLWNGTGWNKVSSEYMPDPRWNSALAYNCHNHETVLFGGRIYFYDLYGYVHSCIDNDTWIWNGETWSEDYLTSAPPPRCSHKMAYDVKNREVVLFGGEDKDHYILYDTWVYDGNRWEQRFPLFIPDIIPQAMLYNRARARITLFGLESDKIHEWDGNNWIPLDAPDTPIFSRGSCFTYDREENAIMVYGAKGKPQYPSSFSGSLWKLGFSPENGVSLERLISHILGSAPFKQTELPFADLNEDGNIDSGDVIYLISHPD